MNAHSKPLSVGIDVSKATLDVAIAHSDGECVSQAFGNDTDSLQRLTVWLREHYVSAKTPIVVESTGSFHWLCCIILSEQKNKVHLINPLLTKKYQQSSIRGAKTDRIDAKRLAEIGIMEKDLPLFFDSRETLSRKRYLSLLNKVEKSKQQLKRACGDAEAAGKSIGVALDLDCINACLAQMDEAIKVLKKMITDQATEEAKKLAEIPGISLFQATALYTAVEGRSFASKDQLVAFFGMDIRARQSGSWQGREKLSKRGNAYYRQILFQMGWSLQRNNETFQQYFNHVYREQKKHYYTALIATARKFLRYYYVYHLQPRKV